MNKHVFEKIAKLEKTELSEVKVDLVSMDDINSAYNQLYDSFSTARNGLSKASKEYRSLEVNYRKEFHKARANAENVLKQFEKASNELGVNPNDIEKYKALATKVNVAGKDYNTLEQEYRPSK